MSSLWLEGDCVRGPESGEAIEVGRGQFLQELVCYAALFEFVLKVKGSQRWILIWRGK